MKRSNLLRNGVDVEHVDTCAAIGENNLMNPRRKALRRGLWFKTLSRLDRMLDDLTIRVRSSVHGSVLTKGLLTVAQKLQAVSGSKIDRITQTVGFLLVQKLNILAQNWSYKAAKAWRNDQDFAHYLILISLNRFAP